MNDMTSDERYSTYGIPQGSSLSSLLFLVYVNDCLEIQYNGYMQMYADDTVLIYSSRNTKELHSSMQQDLETLNEWMFNNSLSFNANKTKYVIFKNANKIQHQLDPVIVNETPIEKVQCSRYLGLIIDEQMNWQVHIQQVKSVLSPYNFVLKRTKYSVPVTTKISLYYAHIHSRLVHLISIRGYTTTSNLQQLQVIQNKAIRSLFWHEYQTTSQDTEQIMKKYKIMNILKLRRFDSSTLIYKIKNEMIRHNIDLPTFSNIHGYTTRGRNDFVIPRARMNILYNSIFVKGLAEYNQLPIMVKNAENFLRFKQKLRTHLLSS